MRQTTKLPHNRVHKLQPGLQKALDRYRDYPIEAECRYKGCLLNSSAGFSTKIHEPSAKIQVADIATQNPSIDPPEPVANKTLMTGI